MNPATFLYKAQRKAKRAAAKILAAGARPLAADFSMQVPFQYKTDAAPPGKVAAICHIYYAELAAEIRSYLENIPQADVYISTSSQEKAAQIKQAFAGWKGAVEIHVVPNRGRDIAPKLIAFKHVYANYSLLLFLHSKKTAYTEHGDDWRTTLIRSLAGSPETVRSIFEMFAAEPKLGMVAPQHFEYIRQFLAWGDNFFTGIALACRMGISITRMGSRALDFPSGSMFWVRPEALAPLLKLNLAWEDFPPEKRQIDGTPAHAIERLFFSICEKAGFIWLKVANAADYKDHSTLVTVKSHAELVQFIKEKTYRILG